MQAYNLISLSFDDHPSSVTANSTLPPIRLIMAFFDHASLQKLQFELIDFTTNDG